MKFLIFSLFIISISDLFGQGFKRISGYIKDSASYEVLIGASIYSPDTKNGTITNNYGFFSMTLPSNVTTLKISYVGYSSKTIELIKADTLMNIFLATETVLKEVVVNGSNNNSVSSFRNNLEVISPKTINNLPVIMGESDLTRTLLLLPGVTFGTENTSGYFVRGGSSDQNLLLIDGVPVYNAYHLYGFFSVFNTDAINNARFYKGGIPARYGGRLSSILDLQLKEGNSQKYSGDVTFGIVSSKFTLEGPILKGRTSFLVTARRSMMDILPESFSRFVSDISGMNKTNEDIIMQRYKFHDLTAKLNHTFSKRSRLYFNIYNGTDNYTNSIGDKDFNSAIKYGNFTTSTRWNYLFANNLFGNFTFYVSEYNYLTKESRLTNSSGNNNLLYNRQFNSGIFDYGIKVDFDYSIPNHDFKFGTKYYIQFVKPGVNTFFQSNTNPDLNIDTTYNFNKKTNNASLFLEDNISFSENISLNAGLYLSIYVIDKSSFSSLQPRLSIVYKIFNNSVIKASFSRMDQTLHLLSANLLGGPSDIWVPATSNAKPETSDQLILGIQHNMNPDFSISIETFIKRMNNLIMYKEGASYLINKSNWENKIESGTGKAFGLEINLQKELGNTKGWISYTWSKSIRQFQNINFGKVFPYTYDRTHDISIAFLQKIGSNFALGADWVFATGNAVTIANTFVEYEVINANSLKIYKGINSYRMPSYHRLDLCLNYRRTIHNVGYTVSIGAYNIYNRANPYCLLDTPERLVVQSLFPVLPYLNLSVKF